MGNQRRFQKCREVKGIKIERKIKMDKKIEGLISSHELLRQLASVKVGEKLILNIETEMSEDLRQGIIRGLRDVKSK